MDFELNEEQQELAGLAATILDEQVDHDRLKAIEASDDGFDGDLWAKLAEAGLLSIAVPEAFGGLGFSTVELCVFARAIGRSVPAVPALACSLAAHTVATHGSDTHKEALLADLATGETIIVPAVCEVAGTDPLQPALQAERDGDDWVLTGAKLKVPYAHIASSFLVTATPHAGSDAGALFLVPGETAGISSERTQVSCKEPQFTVAFDGVRVDGSALVGPAPGTGALHWFVNEYTALLCAMDLGVAERALEIAAEYVKEREQFEQPIGAFQAVHARIADAYIDVAAIRLVTNQLAWQLSEGLDVAEALPIAKYWASEKAYSVCFAAVHLHGGIGVDVDYPLHRYYLWSRELELLLGSGSPQLANFGAFLADAPVNV